ncbi:MAG: ABC transporter permease [Halobacteriaceae archaeon]
MVLAVVAVLAVVFYYPVGTVLHEAVRVPHAVSTALADQPVLAVLADPFYTGAAHTVFEAPARVPAGLGRWARTGFGVPSFGLFGFTAYQAALSTVASVALGLPGAYVLSRFEFPGRQTVRSLTILPFVLPAILVAIGFIAAFGQTGTLSAVLTAVGLGPVNILFSLEAIVLAHAFYNAPLVTRFVTAAWESVDVRHAETARSLGASRLRAFRDAVLPQLFPAILTAGLLTFLFTFMSFPIVLTLGGLRLATVEVWLFARVQRLDLTEAAALATVETAISLGLTYLYLRYEARRAQATTGGQGPGRRPLLVGTETLRDPVRVGLLGYAVVAGVVFLLPLASVVVESLTGPAGFTLRYWEFLLDQQQAAVAGVVKPATAIRNSLLFAAGTLAVALPMGTVVAVASTRSFRGRKILDALLMGPLAVSSIVVGLGLLQGLVFGATLFGHRVTVTGPVAVVMAHAVAAYPFVTRNVAPQLAGLDRRLPDAARALGASRVRALLDVELPLVASGLVAGAAFAAAISVGEFDSTVILAEGARASTMPVAVDRYVGNRSLGPDLGPAAAMGTVLLAVTAGSFAVIDRLGGRWEQ